MTTPSPEPFSFTPMSSREHSPVRAVPVQPTVESVKAELAMARLENTQLKYRIDALKDGAAMRVAENKLQAAARKIEQMLYSKTKDDLKAVENKLTRTKDALATESTARVAEKERADAVEKRLAQLNATLKIENSKRKLVELYNEKVNTTHKKRKRELELELSTEEWRLGDLVDEAKEK